MTEVLPFGIGAWIFIALYISSLLVVGVFAYRARQEDTLKDFYLAGSGFGFTVLLLTLYATQYSGNSLFGFTGMTYRIGYSWIMSVHFMIAIVIFYQLIAVRLFRLARDRGYITPVDFLHDRFQSKAISFIAAIVMILALSNFLLAQLMAMGRAMQGLAGPHGDQAYQYGVIILALIMVIYGTLGGIRAIAWTDMMQGAVLMVGFLLLIIMLYIKFGPLSQATELIMASDDPLMVKKMMPPDAAQLREWLSYILIVGMGGALYPHAIQRIYAARSEKVLRKSLAVMAFLPFFTTLIAVITGIYAIAYVSGLEGAASDQVLGRLLRRVQEDSVFGYSLVVLLFAAVLSAIMSTADSALLSISSMLSKDIYGKFINAAASDAQMTRLGKICSWSLIVILIGFAISLREESSLVKLLDRKFDVLVQLVPAFMLGIRWSKMQTLPTLIGLISGLVLALSLAFLPFEFVQSGKVWGFHPGLYGLLLNLLIAVVGSLYISRRRLVP
ncbi:MAG: SSS family solute:Na+ symporter [Planctomycetota bacterium]|jgi:SSS family solute:Na+ symporter